MFKVRIPPTRGSITTSLRTYLDLVVDKNSSNFIASRPECPQESLVRSSHPSFSLYWLNNHSARIFIDQLHQVLWVRIIELPDPHVGDKGRKWRLVLRVRGHAQRTHRPSMKPMLKAHKRSLRARRRIGGRVLLRPALLPDLPRKFERALVRLCASASEEHLRTSVVRGTGCPSEAALALCQLDEKLRELSSPFVMIEIARMGETGCLCLHDRRDLFVPMA